MQMYIQHQDHLDLVGWFVYVLACRGVLIPLINVCPLNVT